MKRLAAAAFVALAMMAPATASAAPGSPFEEFGSGPFLARAPGADLALAISDSQDPVNVNESFRKTASGQVSVRGVAPSREGATANAKFRRTAKPKGASKALPRCSVRKRKLVCRG